MAGITNVLEKRAREAGALAFVLTGSTARGRRTRVSDLDYHVIGGSPPDLSDLPEDIDLYTDDPERFRAKLRRGDDFAHWTVRYGCVLLDSGVIGEADAWIAETNSWPDARRKLSQAQDALRFADDLLDSGDYPAALEQYRSALSILARGLLLANGDFPLARDELPGQLRAIGRLDLARALRRSMDGRPLTDEMKRSIARARRAGPMSRNLAA
ncbi:MAG TPA: hypothetical protein VH268_12225 [Solirubrobacterales bacterium]|nr:hypothetical protein [Solirubrobacterales bacterium]